MDQTLRDVWESQGMGIMDVARLSGVAINTVYNALHKEPTVQRKNLVKICIALRMSEEEYHELAPGK